MLEKTLTTLSGTVVLDALVPPEADDAAAGPFTLQGDVLLRWNDGAVTVAVVPAGVREIGRWAFRDCAALTEIVLPDSVAALGFEAFRGCTGLSRLNIPAGVRTIGARAFLGCPRLAGLKLPDGVAAMAAQGRRSLETFVSERTEADAGGVLARAGDFLIRGGELLQYLGRAALVAVPEGITAIKDQAFRGCDTLRSVVIPASVEYIHDHAFADCRGLAEVTLPDTPISFGQAVFSGCTALEAINFSGRQSPDLFAGCTALRQLVLPERVAEVSSNTFTGCTHLARLTALGAEAVVRSWGFWPRAGDEVVGSCQTALIAPRIAPEAAVGAAIRAGLVLGYLDCPHLYDDAQTAQYEAFLTASRDALLHHAARHGLLPLLEWYIHRDALPGEALPALVDIARQSGRTEAAARLLSFEVGGADAAAAQTERDIADLLGL